MVSVKLSELEPEPEAIAAIDGEVARAARIVPMTFMRKRTTGGVENTKAHFHSGHE
jgi:hypothetical protein